MMVRFAVWCSPLFERQFRLDAAFFLAVPAALALTMVITGGYVGALGWIDGLLYVAALSFVPWWAAGLATHLAAWLLRRRKVPLWGLTVLGVLAASLALVPYIQAVNMAFVARSSGALVPLSWPLTPGGLADIALGAGRAAVLWTAFVYIFTVNLDWQRYCTPVAVAERTAAWNAPAISNNGTSWSQEDDATLTAFVASGMPPKEIARRMQRTIAAVRARIQKLNLRKNDR